MELLIHVVDKGPTPDCAWAGDLIEVFPNRHGWSEAELTNPEWRIIRSKLFGTTINALKQRSIVGAVDPIASHLIYRIDLSKLPEPELYVGKRTQPLIRVPREVFELAVVKRNAHNSD